MIVGTPQETMEAAWWLYALLGLSGGFVVDGLAYVRFVRTSKGILPRNFWSLPYVLGFVIRLLSGAILAMVLGAGGQVSVPVGAFVIGITAPAVIDQYFKP